MESSPSQQTNIKNWRSLHLKSFTELTTASVKLWLVASNNLTHHSNCLCRLAASQPAEKMRDSSVDSERVRRPSFKTKLFQVAESQVLDQGVCQKVQLAAVHFCLPCARARVSLEPDIPAPVDSAACAPESTFNTYSNKRALPMSGRKLHVLQYRQRDIARHHPCTL